MISAPDTRALPLPGTPGAAQSALSRAWQRLAPGFPWLLFAITWVATLILEGRMDAPSTWGENQTVSDLALGASDGSLSRRIVIVFLGGVGALLLRRYSGRYRIHGVLALLLSLYIGWIGLSAVWADDPSLAFRRLVAFGLMFIFAAGCAARMNADSLSLFIAGVPALTLIPGLIAELRYGFSPFGANSRFTGTAVHPNVQAAYLAVAGIILCWFVWRVGREARFRVGMISAIVLVFLVLTRSRTSIAAVGAALLFSVFLVMARDFRRRLPALAAALLLFAGLGGVLDAVIASGSSSSAGILSIVRAGRDDADSTPFNGRVDLWRTCLGYAAERPWTGYGYGSFWSAKRIEDISAEEGWALEQSHSAYIDQLLALGVPGAALYVLVLLGCFSACIVRFFRHEDTYGAWAAVLFFIALHNATESTDIMPLYTNFAFHLIVLHTAWIRPGSPSRARLPLAEGLAGGWTNLRKRATDG
ncbi:MAG TPA: O-antigen ligase family protein [Acidobacteriaceae bacterium]|nr:O-antigen ligase family protein [Acidobacteriaceae bacterium]